MLEGGEKKDSGIKMWKVLIPSTLIPIIIGVISYLQSQAVDNYKIEQTDLKIEKLDNRIEKVEAYNPELMNFKLNQIYEMVEKIERKINE